MGEHRWLGRFPATLRVAFVLGSYAHAKPVKFVIVLTFGDKHRRASHARCVRLVKFGTAVMSPNNGKKICIPLLKREHGFLCNVIFLFFFSIMQGYACKKKCQRITMHWIRIKTFPSPIPSRHNINAYFVVRGKIYARTRSLSYYYYIFREYFYRTLCVTIIYIFLYLTMGTRTVPPISFRTRYFSRFFPVVTCSWQNLRVYVLMGFVVYVDLTLYNKVLQ